MGSINLKVKFKTIGINLSNVKTFFDLHNSVVMFMTCREIVERNLDTTIVIITGVDEKRQLIFGML